MDAVRCKMVAVIVLLVFGWGFVESVPTMASANHWPSKPNHDWPMKDCFCKPSYLCDFYECAQEDYDSDCSDSEEHPTTTNHVKTTTVSTTTMAPTTTIISTTMEPTTSTTESPTTKPPTKPCDCTCCLQFCYTCQHTVTPPETTTKPSEQPSKRTKSKTVISHNIKRSLLIARIYKKLRDLDKQTTNSSTTLTPTHTTTKPSKHIRTKSKTNISYNTKRSSIIARIYKKLRDVDKQTTHTPVSPISTTVTPSASTSPKDENTSKGPKTQGGGGSRKSSQSKSSRLSSSEESNGKDREKQSHDESRKSSQPKPPRQSSSEEKNRKDPETENHNHPTKSPHSNPESTPKTEESTTDSSKKQDQESPRKPWMFNLWPMKPRQLKQKILHKRSKPEEVSQLLEDYMAPLNRVRSIVNSASKRDLSSLEPRYKNELDCWVKPWLPKCRQLRTSPDV